MTQTFLPLRLAGLVFFNMHAERQAKEYDATFARTASDAYRIALTHVEEGLPFLAFTKHHRAVTEI